MAELPAAVRPHPHVVDGGQSGDFAILVAAIRQHADLTEVREDTLRSPLP